MLKKFQVGKEIVPGFRVNEVKSKSVLADPSNPITNFVEVKLDCSYENLAFLAFATFQEKPPSEQWRRLSLSGTENIRQLWKPQKIKQECVGIDYNKWGQSGHIVAVSHAIAAKGNVLVSAQLIWFGFPFVNWFFVGFKPGMRERTEELLLAGLNLV